jgi:hypothetical protein
VLLVLVTDIVRVNGTNVLVLVTDLVILVLLVLVTEIVPVGDRTNVFEGDIVVVGDKM